MRNPARTLTTIALLATLLATSMAPVVAAQSAVDRTTNALEDTAGSAGEVAGAGAGLADAAGDGAAGIGDAAGQAAGDAAKANDDVQEITQLDPDDPPTDDPEGWANDVVFRGWSWAANHTFFYWNQAANLTYDTWNALANITVHTWNLTAENAYETWNATASAAYRSWNRIATATYRTWNGIADATYDAWRATANAAYDTWHVMADLVVSTVWEATSAAGGPAGQAGDAAEPVLEEHTEQCEDGWRIEGSACIPVPVSYDGGYDEDGSGAPASDPLGPTSQGADHGTNAEPVGPRGDAPACGDTEPIGFSLVVKSGKTVDRCIRPKQQPLPSDACEPNAAEAHVVQVPGGHVDIRIYAPEDTDKMRLVVRDLSSPLYGVQVRAGDDAFEYQYYDAAGSRADHPGCVISTLTGVKLAVEGASDPAGSAATQKLFHAKQSPRNPLTITFEDTLTLDVEGNPHSATARYYVVTDVPSDTWKGVELGRLHSAHLQDDDGDEDHPYVPKRFGLQVGFDADAGYVYAEATDVVKPTSTPGPGGAEAPAIALHRIGTEQPIAFNPLEEGTVVEVHYESSGGDVRIGSGGDEESYIEFPGVVDATLTLDGEQIVFENLPTIRKLEVETGAYADCDTTTTDHTICVSGTLVSPADWWDTVGADVILESYGANLTNIPAGPFSFAKSDVDDLKLTVADPGADLTVRDTFMISELTARGLTYLEVHPNGAFQCMRVTGMFSNPRYSGSYYPNLDIEVDPTGEDDGTEEAEPTCNIDDPEDDGSGDEVGRFSVSAWNLKWIHKGAGFSIYAHWYDDGVGGGFEFSGSVDDTTLSGSGDGLVRMSLIKDYGSDVAIALRNVKAKDSGRIDLDIHFGYQGGGCWSGSAAAWAYTHPRGVSVVLDHKEASNAYEAQVHFDIPYCPDRNHDEDLSAPDEHTYYYGPDWLSNWGDRRGFNFHVLSDP